VTTVLFARHGETEWNRSGRWQGHSNPPLSEVGKTQAKELAAELAGAPIAAAYSSDLARARETAEIVAAPHGLQVTALATLREVDVGDWSGLTWSEIEARFPDRVSRHLTAGHGWQGGESYEAMGERVLAALRSIAENHPAEQVLVVGHGGGLRALAAHADGMTVASHRGQHSPARNCQVYRFAIQNGAVRRLGIAGSA
jgi:phosphoserine phosphatase